MGKIVVKFYANIIIAITYFFPFQNGFYQKIPECTNCKYYNTIFVNFAIIFRFSKHLAWLTRVAHTQNCITFDVINQNFISVFEFACQCSCKLSNNCLKCILNYRNFTFSRKFLSSKFEISPGQFNKIENQLGQGFKLGIISKKFIFGILFSLGSYNLYSLYD